MANAITARVQGDEYQARIFWLEATRLYADQPVVTAVGYEVDGVRAFDDVAVFYDGPHGCGTDPGVRADYYQVKFHVTLAGAFTAEALTQPAFIGAERVSLLQRLRDAQRRHAPNGTEARFIIISPWTVDAHDPLAKIVSQNEGEIRLDKLREGGPRSEMGRVRGLWRTHLEMETDEGLFVMLRTLRIRSDFPTLEGLRWQLDARLKAAGMNPYPEGKLANPYDLLPTKLMQRGQRKFSRADMDDIVARESLAAPREQSARPVARQLGIRSFSRWAEHMEDETEKMLCLQHHFDGRVIRDAALWNATVVPDVFRFLSTAVEGTAVADLHLDTHSSIAFAAGWFLDPKGGVAASPVQRGANGRSTWCAVDCLPCRDEHVWTRRTIAVAADRADLALVLNVTRSAIGEAEPFIQEQLPSVGQILELTPCSGIGGGSVRDAAHGRRLADDAAGLVSAALHARPRDARVHVFAAAPNGMMFFLGQAAHVWGRCVLYEHDFERVNDRAYAPSIRLPSSS